MVERQRLISMLNRVSICINFISGVFMGELENKLVELLKIKKVGMSTEETRWQNISW